MQRLIARVLLIISFLTAIFTYLNINPSIAGQPPLEDRASLHQSISLLEDDVNSLAQELLVLDLKAKKAEQKKHQTEKELESTRVKRDAALVQYNESLETKQKTIKKIGPWLNFQYKYGYWSLIDAILGSSSLSDMISRTMIVSFILSRQVNDYRAAQGACEVSLQKEQTLKEAVDRLSQQSLALENQIREIKTISEHRRQYLEEIKMTSSDLAQKVMAIESKFLQTLNLYSFITGALAKFPWQEMNPDNISMNSSGIQVEITENNLNNTIRSSGDEELKNLSVDLQPGVFNLSGKDRQSLSSFTLGGALVPDGEKPSVRVNLSSLSLDGIPVTSKVLGELSQDSFFQLPLPAEMKVFSISRIEITDERFIIYLKSW